MGSRHRDRSRDRSRSPRRSDRERDRDRHSRSRDRDRDRRSRHRTKSRDRDRRSSRDRRSRSRDNRRRDRDRHRSSNKRSSHRSRSRDTKSWDRKSRDRDSNRDRERTPGRPLTGVYKITEETPQEVSLLDTFASLATSRNFSSLVTSVSQELYNQNSNGSGGIDDDAPPNESKFSILHNMYLSSWRYFQYEFFRIELIDLQLVLEIAKGGVECTVS